MTKVEKIKSDSNYLRGTLKESIKSGVTGAIADDDQIILKFHGSYQQDDRDARDRRAEKKLEKLFSFMIRLRIAGGKISAKEWIGINKVAEQNANPTIKITTRQTIQLHGVIKSKLKPTIASFYEYGLDSIAACGDVNRNVMTSVAIAQNKGYDEVYEYGKKISDYLLPHTKAYHEIWLDEEQILGESSSYLGGGSAFATKSQVAERGGAESEPLYGKTYLPRKFKIVIAIPPENDVDLYAHDIGLIAIIENGELLGFNVTVGGGMGATHGKSLNPLVPQLATSSQTRNLPLDRGGSLNPLVPQLATSSQTQNLPLDRGKPETFPRIGDLIGFVRKEKILDATYQIAAIQRDFGNREERAKSRFKYTIEKYGVAWFISEFEKRFGEKLEKAREFKLEKRGDHFGWKQDYLGQNHFTLFVEAGQVFGETKKALLEIAEKNLGNFRCTNNQNVIISDVAPVNKKAVEDILERCAGSPEESSRRVSATREEGRRVSATMGVNNFSPIRLDSIACVALNTCSLALAEGQRYLPSLITKIEPILEKYNLAQEPISIRMTGCPNGCGRPYLAEIGLVGKSLGKYNLFLGGDRLGKRLNRLYKEDLGEAEILAELDNFLGKYSQQRQSQEDFGDFILRTHFQGENH